MVQCFAIAIMDEGSPEKVVAFTCTNCSTTFENQNLLRDEEVEVGEIICPNPDCGALLRIDPTAKINTPEPAVGTAGLWPC